MMRTGVDVTTTVKTTWCGVLWMAKYITKKTLTMEWRTVYTTSAIVSVNGGDAPVQKNGGYAFLPRRLRKTQEHKHTTVMMNVQTTDERPVLGAGSRLAIGKQHS
jgi:hypothetical protein